MDMTKQRALITGASSGIGKALAWEFAKNGHPVVLTAEDNGELEAVAQGIRDSFKTEVAVIAADLTKETAPQEIYDSLKEKGLDIHVLINNAGVGFRSPFAEAPLDKIIEILRLDIEALTRMTHLFLPDMLARGEGRILNVGSVAGYQPGPTMAVYHAAKAYVVSLSESLIEELKDTKVTVTCLAPGPVDTNFFDRAAMPDARANDPKMQMQPEEIAKAAHEGSMRGEHVVMPGMINKVMTFTRRVMPMELQAKLQKQFYESKEE
jgi:short-subunit dehydrogenase